METIELLRKGFLNILGELRDSGVLGLPIDFYIIDTRAVQSIESVNPMKSSYKVYYEIRYNIDGIDKNMSLIYKGNSIKTKEEIVGRIEDIIS